MSPGNNMKPQYTVDISASAAAYNAASPAEKDSLTFLLHLIDVSKYIVQ